MTSIILDGLNEEDFRRSIENRLREGMAGAAIERLRGLLAPYAGPEGPLPERFLTVQSSDLFITGWDSLLDAIRRRDQPYRPITAISIAMGPPEGESPQPDESGKLRPHIETSYYNDNAFPFSESAREDLLEGYSYYGCTWSGDCEATDTSLSLGGIDDLNGALAALEARLLAREEPDEHGISAGSLGACMLSALFVQAVADRIAQDGVPRALCVMAGNNGVYPYFDAPVAGMPEEARKAGEERDTREALPEATAAVPAPRYSSLLMTGIPRAKKRAVLVLDESDSEMTSRIARLRGLNHGEDAEAEVLDEVPMLEPVEEMVAEFNPSMPGSPLLAKKPHRSDRSLNDILGMSDTTVSILHQSDDDCGQAGAPDEAFTPAQELEPAAAYRAEERFETAEAVQPVEAYQPVDLTMPIGEPEPADLPVPMEIASSQPIYESVEMRVAEPASPVLDMRDTIEAYWQAATQSPRVPPASLPPVWESNFARPPAPIEVVASFGPAPLQMDIEPLEPVALADSACPTDASPTTETPIAEVPPRTPVHLPDPPEPDLRDPATTLPGFALLEPDLQQRLQRLISGEALPSANSAPSLAEPAPIAEQQPATDPMARPIITAPSEPASAQPAPAARLCKAPTETKARSKSLGGRLLTATIACVARLGIKRRR